MNELREVTLYAAERLRVAAAGHSYLTHAAGAMSYGDREKTVEQLAFILEAAGLAVGVLKMLAAGMAPDDGTPPVVTPRRDGRGRFVAGGAS